MYWRNVFLGLAVFYVFMTASLLGSTFWYGLPPLGAYTGGLPILYGFVFLLWVSLALFYDHARRAKRTGDLFWKPLWLPDGTKQRINYRDPGQVLFGIGMLLSMIGIILFFAFRPTLPGTSVTVFLLDLGILAVVVGRSITKPHTAKKRK